MSVSPASRVIDRFGGQSKLARLIGKRASTVQYWVSTGRIPPKWHARLLELADEEGVSCQGRSKMHPSAPVENAPLEGLRPGARRGP